MKRNISKILLCSFMLVMMFLCVNTYAKINWGNKGIYIGAPDVSGVNASQLDAVASTNRIWNTVRYILQATAVGLFIYSGVRYMMAAPDQKADIKKSMGILVIGAVLVFGASLVIAFIQEVTLDLTI